MNRLCSLLALAIPVAVATPSYAAAPTSFTCSGINYVSSDRMGFASGCSPSYTGAISDFLLLNDSVEVFCGTGNDTGTTIVGRSCVRF